MGGLNEQRHGGGEEKQTEGEREREALQETVDKKDFDSKAIVSVMKRAACAVR